MAKSKKNVSYSLSGVLNLAEGTITELAKESEFVYDFSEILNSFDEKEVVITIKEASEIESVE